MTLLIVSTLLIVCVDNHFSLKEWGCVLAELAGMSEKCVLLGRLDNTSPKHYIPPVKGCCLAGSYSRQWFMKPDM